METTTFTIRPFRTGDEEGVVRAVRETYDEYGFTWDAEDYNADLYDLEEHYGGPASAFWVAEGESGILGCVGLETCTPVEGPEGVLVPTGDLPRIGGTDCALLRLYVRPSARRRGIGMSLTKTVIDEARRRGCLLMEIWSDKRLTKAHRLYEGLGAIRVGERICDDPDDSPEWGMMLRL